MSGLTKSTPGNITSPPGNSLAIYIDANDNILKAKDINGKIVALSTLLPSSGGGTPTLPSVYMGYTTDSSPITLSELLDDFNLTVAEGTIPVLFYTDAPGRSTQAVTRKYIWKLGAGEFNPVGGDDIENKLELITDSFASADDVDIILSSENAEEISLGIISENFVSYMNTHGPYVFTNVDKTYIITFTRDEIDYAYIFQGALGTYGLGQLQFTSDSFVFIYKSTNAGQAVNSTYVRITRAEAEILKTTSSFVPGTTYVITNADLNLYGGTEITLFANSASVLSQVGSGLFYTPKYDLSAESTGYGIFNNNMVGTFTDIVGVFDSKEIVTAQNGATATFLANGYLIWLSGDWTAATSISGAIATANVSGFITPNYEIDQIVHWGGKSWTTLAEGTTIPLDKYTLASEQFEEIPFNEEDYNVYVDEIQYDFVNDMIISRKDRYNNEVTSTNQIIAEFISPDGFGLGNPIKDFQWGCMQDDWNPEDYFELGIQGNKVIDSYFETINCIAKTIWQNNIIQFSLIHSNILDVSSIIKNNNLENFSNIDNNILLVNSGITINILEVSGISSNTLISNSRITNGNYNSSQVYQNILNASQISQNILSTSQIFTNNLSNSFISSNNLYQNSQIHTNIADNSQIRENILNNNSQIYSNSLSASSIIIGNNLGGVSKIYNNTLTSSRFQDNNLSANSIFKFTTTIPDSEIIAKCSVQGFNVLDSDLDVTGSTVILQSQLPKFLFDNQAMPPLPRLSYYNNLDVLIVANINV